MLTEERRIMNKLLVAFLTALVLGMPAARAANDEDENGDEEEHAAHQHGTAAGGEASGQKGHNPAKHLQMNMKTMQEVMTKIGETTDPAEKKRLLRVHMLAMQEHIKTMRSISADQQPGSGSSAHDHGDQGTKGGDSKKGGVMGGGMMGGGMMGGGMMKMHKKVEQRLDAIEQLLEQLIEHGAAEDTLEGK
jgi:hypothetical protein